MKRKNRVIRFSEKEWEIVKEKAIKSNMIMADYIRTQALKGEINIYNWEWLHKLVYEIRQCGININQVAKLCNQTQSVNENDVVELGEQVNELRNVIEIYLKPLNEYIIENSDEEFVDEDDDDDELIKEEDLV